MIKLLLSLALVPNFVVGQALDKEVKERVHYFKSHPIFVIQLTLDKRAMKKSSEEEMELAKLEAEKINKNIRSAFLTFWDISDTVIFVADTELKAKMKKFKGGIFFELVEFGEDSNGPIIAFRLFRPNRADYFDNVIPRAGVDTSLVNMITEVRQLRLNVATGDIMNTIDLGIKVILINREEERNQFGEEYVDLIRSKFKDSIIEVDNDVLLDVIMRRDPKYIYVHNAATYNAEDGTLIALY